MDKGLEHSDYCVFYFRASGFWVGPGCWGLRGSVCSWGCSPCRLLPFWESVLWPGGEGLDLGLLPSCCLGFLCTPWALWAPRCLAAPQSGCGPPTTSRVKLSYTHTYTCTQGNTVLRQSWDWFYCLCFRNRCAVIVHIWCYCYCVDCRIVVAAAADWHSCFTSANQDSLKGLTQSSPDCSFKLACYSVF